MKKDAVTWGFVTSRIQARKRAWEKKRGGQHPGVERRKDVEAAQISSDPQPLTGSEKIDARAMLRSTKRQYKGLSTGEISEAQRNIQKFKREGGVEEAREILKFALILPRMGMARARLSVMKSTKVPMPRGLKPPSAREAIGMPPRGLAQETSQVKRLKMLFEGS